MKQYICIDIGGTEIKAQGCWTKMRNFLQRVRCPPRPLKARPALLKRSWELQRTTWKERKAEGICVSTAGMVDVERGRYSMPPL